MLMDIERESSAMLHQNNEEKNGMILIFDAVQGCIMCVEQIRLVSAQKVRGCQGVKCRTRSVRYDEIR